MPLERRMGFEILAALDLRGGRVVRLRRGEFDAETVYGTDPVATAESLVSRGVRWLHVVDLDGARAGRVEQSDTIARVVAGIGARASIEVGGGIRDAATATRLLQAGVTRVVLGTGVLADPGLAKTIVERHGPASVAAAIDVRHGRAVGEAWQDGAAGTPARDAIRRLEAVGVKVFEVTGIDRDGTLEGPDLGLLADLVELDAGQVIASGGIRSVDDLERVQDLGCAGAIVGRALYEGRIDLEEALRRFGSG